MNAITKPLTPDQKRGQDMFTATLLNPNERCLVIEGYAGTGKSTLVSSILRELPATLKTAQLISETNIEWKVVLTATTNKAAEALSGIVGQEVKTIQSFLGLRVSKDHRIGTSSLIPKDDSTLQRHKILFIDEASFIDSHLLDWIFKLTKDCIIIFIGDPAQITPVKSNQTPVFNAGFPTVKLEKVVRQDDGNPIITLATAFRDTVNTGVWPQFKPDGEHIQVLSRPDFETLLLAEFSREEWKYSDSKILAWTNKTVIAYNRAVRSRVVGTPELEVGDYAVCNNHISNRNCKLKTDQLVQITAIDPAIDRGVEGWNVQLDHSESAFLPKDLADRKRLLAEAKAAEEYGKMASIESSWIDLRAAYACTINKSQGSTYRKVFIDLDDIKKCNQANQIARMLYVAVSRASHQVFFTGDLV